MRLLPLDFGSAEREVASEQPAPSPDPEKVFEQEFVRALFERAVAAVRREYEGKERHAQFALFERYDLFPEEGLSYARLAETSGLTMTQVTNQLAQVRRRFHPAGARLHHHAGRCGAHGRLVKIGTRTRKGKGKEDRS